MYEKGLKLGDPENEFEDDPGMFLYEIAEGMNHVWPNYPISADELLYAEPLKTEEGRVRIELVARTEQIVQKLVDAVSSEKLMWVCEMKSLHGQGLLHSLFGQPDDPSSQHRVSFIYALDKSKKLLESFDKWLRAHDVSPDVDAARARITDMSFRYDVDDKSLTVTAILKPPTVEQPSSASENDDDDDDDD